jgi:hypothetical protein
MDLHAAPARRHLRIVIGVAVLAGLAWFFLFRGDAAPTGAALPADVPPLVQESVTKVADAGSAKGHKQTFEVFAPKDPFDPLVEPPSADEGGTSKGAGLPGRGDHVVTLQSVVNDMEAAVVVDDSEYMVALGDTFADSFQLVSVGGKCASLLYGDEQFTVCEGQEVTK